MAVRPSLQLSVPSLSAWYVEHGRRFLFVDCGTCDGSGQIVVSGRNYLGTDTCPECAERKFKARESVRLAALAAELAELEQMWELE
jgi:hypothetical protein